MIDLSFIVFCYIAFYFTLMLEFIHRSSHAFKGSAVKISIPYTYV